MDIDSETIPDGGPSAIKDRAPVDCRTRRRRTPQVTADTQGGQSRRCTEPVERLQVPVASHPKPRAPVATKVRIPPTKCATAAHEWSIISANGFSRRYFCKCGIEVREKKENDFWISVQYNIGEPREPDHTPRQPRHAAPQPQEDQSDEDEPIEDAPPARRRRTSSLSTVPEESTQLDDSSDSESDSKSGMSLYHSTDERTPQMPVIELPSPNPPPNPPRRPSADRASGGTTASDAPSSLCGFAIRRLPARPGSDISSPIGRPRLSSSSRRTSSRGTSGSTAELRTPASLSQPELSPSPVSSPAITPVWPFVSQNPKPEAPVATLYIPQCSAGVAHTWKKWGNQTHRRYTCSGCNHIVKERKAGHPEVWAPAD